MRGITRIAAVLAVLVTGSVGLDAAATGSPTVVRGPYLQLSTPQSIVVRWRTDTATTSRVLYGTVLGNLDQSVVDSAVTTEHSMVLSGLAPDVTYYYAIGTSATILAGDDASYSFATPPLAGSARPTRIWVLGDSGTADQNARDVRDAYEAFTGSRRTDLWLMLGDNAYPVGNDAQYQAAVFDTYPEMLRQSALWPTIGNHDSFSADSPTQTGTYYDVFTLPTTAQAGGIPSGTEAYYSFDYANIHFVVLDSMDTDRSPAGAMLTWLAQDLAATTQDWIIAYWHHPPYSKGSHDSDTELELVEMRENVLPILEDYGVDLTLAGHSHSYERSYLIDGHYGTSDTFGPQYLVDGGDGQEDGDGAYHKYYAPHRGMVHTVAGSSGMTNGGPLNHPAMLVSLDLLGSLVLDIDGERLDAVFLGATGTVLDHFTIVKSVAVAPIAAFSGAPLAGMPPLAVDFADLSQNFPESWGWDFDNNGTIDSTAAEPSHVYSQPGLYSVRLNVANIAGTDQVVQQGYICVSGGAPGEITGLRFTPVDTTFSWTAEPRARSYDVVKGSLGQLRATRGAFNASQLACLATVTTATQSSDAQLPGPGQAFFYVVRGVGCLDETGTYDTTGPGQVGTRDFELQGSGALCACPATADGDADGFCSGFDNCSAVANPDQANLDNDADGDACDLCTDTDGDGAGNPGFPANTCATDNCPAVTNVNQANADGDSFGDSCDVCPLDAANDADLDTVCGNVDNCPAVANANQANFDGDATGDACDSCTDSDNDGFGNPGFPLNTCAADNCPTTANVSQANLDGDATGDACDPCTDSDNDGFGNPGFPANTCAADNCPATANVSQANFDGDATGDACDPCTDSDNDGFGNPGFSANTCATDNCPTVSNASQANLDGDATGDACDSCTDSDNDGFGNPGFSANTCATDNCPTVSNASQANSDGDPVGNACDNCPSIANPTQANADGDARGDVCDTCPNDNEDDIEGDGHCANADNCPSIANPGQADGDANGIGNACQFVPVLGQFYASATEVTNGEYALFLNAVAKTDANALYNTSMSSSPMGGINRSGSSGSFVYTVRTNMGDKPVNFVSWLDAARFANWMQHGRPTGPQGSSTTETGAYDLTVINPGLTAVRSSGALWFLPTKDEWDAAAYADPLMSVTWVYPTRSDTPPTGAAATSTGNVANPGWNVANYGRSADWNGQNGNVTTVASAGPLSTSRWGTYDQGGNVREWVESLGPNSAERRHRGGSFSDAVNELRGSTDRDDVYTLQEDRLGFRIAAALACPDADGDGYSVHGNPGCAGGMLPDCNDANATVYAGAPQLCDGVNNDCSAAGWPAVPANEADADGDGYALCEGDCDDGENDRFPGNPEICDGLDNDCDGSIPPSEADPDLDGRRNCVDNCPTVANANQANADGDATGDACDPCTDTDGDGAGNPGFPANTCVTDNCPTVANANQANADGDALGDACDPCTDTDGDGKGNPGFPASTCAPDNCPAVANSDQANADGDALGDACDPCTDTDGDGAGNPGFPANTCATDNCPAIANANQANADGDALGDACDSCTDIDGDGTGDPGFPANTCAVDNCPAVANANQADADGDALGDACDKCTDTDGDGTGDPGFPENICATDNCPTIANPAQADTDGDGLGDACDRCTDTDGDGYGNPGFHANTCEEDNCPDIANPDQTDTDHDGIGDACDS